MGNNSTLVDSLDSWLKERNAMLDDLRFHFLRAQHRMKQWADLKRKPESFELGDLVFLKLQPYRQSSIARRPCDKLAARFYGPFEIIGKVGEVAYRLQLPDTSRIHPVFHISQLKRAHGAAFNPTPIPAHLSSSLELTANPEEVLGIRADPLNPAHVLEVLIQWHGLPLSDATWEPFSTIKTAFPAFHLEDKVSSIGVGNVMDPDYARPSITQVYSRRNRALA